ncbi:MAG: hypothetical protein IJ829_03675 [Kiritimatiellae bacterium]|nr:hypothetical protein [Kiritimatiellia bacterium]
MKRFALTALLMAYGLFPAAFAQEALHVRIGPVLEALRAGDSTTLLSYTNVLESAAVSSPVMEDAATCRIIEAYLLLDVAGTEADENAYARATNICATVRHDMLGHTNTWQLYGAELALSDAYVVDGKQPEAFSMKTNLLSKIVGLQFANAETNIWPALSCYLFESNSISFHDAVRTGAALCKTIMRDTSDIAAYTNGLPAGVIGIIDGMPR